MKKIDCKFIFNSFFNYSKKKYLIYYIKIIFIFYKIKYKLI